MGINEHGTTPNGDDSGGIGSPALVLDFQAPGARQTALVGGKGASLAELSAIEDLQVPTGFCVTTDAFRAFASSVAAYHDVLKRLARLDAGDRDAIRVLSAEMRQAIERTPLPTEIVGAVSGAIAAIGDEHAYAVRSSATAEDSPATSFAGQHDSFLGINGVQEILTHISRVWSSLFTERAVTYRLRSGEAQRSVQMAVVVQTMVEADASGVLFTADPMTSNRRIASVEAVPGLGEQLVSGRVNPDVSKVRDGEIVEEIVAGDASTLSQEQLLRLVELGRRIEARFGRPQDIEWCLAGDEFAIVQSRPITTLFPIPARDDGDRHVYASVGHQQMMTDAMKPLGLSMHQLIAMVPMYEAGSRLFVDVSRALSTPTGRTRLLQTFAQADPLTAGALQTVVDRGDFIPLDHEPPAGEPPSGATPPSIPTDPAIVDDLVRQQQTSLADLKHNIQGKSGAELFEFIAADVQELKAVAFAPRSMQVIMAAMESTWWLNDQLETWLGEKHASDELTQSVPGNITSEMGLALLDVADVIRPFPEVLEVLEDPRGEDVLERLGDVRGGPQARDAIAGFLEVYGMRCAGEIDITRPRWSERPSTLIPALLGNVRNFEPGAGRRRFAQGLHDAQAAEDRLLQAVGALPDGAEKAAQTKAMIDRLRTFSGYREYPKYSIVCRHYVYKQALLTEARRLAAAGVLADPEDVFFLTFDEFRDTVDTGSVDADLIARRRRAFRADQDLTPPRVLTSEGDALSGSYGPRDAPSGALVGLPVSGGTVEGRARVILDMADADLQPGDILVTTFTDPSWTPVFVAVEGLVTEVGGLMTHGAVIAREYGLPAVVGVQQATQLIRDGQQIRVHGTQGYVELLS